MKPQSICRNRDLPAGKELGNGMSQRLNFYFIYYSLCITNHMISAVVSRIVFLNEEIVRQDYSMLVCACVGASGKSVKIVAN